MEMAGANRRNQILGQCWQLKNGMDSYNERRCPDNPIQMDFNYFHPVCAATRAISARCSAVSFMALALPPFSPPALPRTTPVEPRR